MAILRDCKSEDIERRRATAFGLMQSKHPVPPDSVFFDPLSEEDIEAMFNEHGEIME